MHCYISLSQTGTKLLFLRIAAMWLFWLYWLLLRACSTCNSIPAKYRQARRWCCLRQRCCTWAAKTAFTDAHTMAFAPLANVLLPFQIILIQTWLSVPDLLPLIAIWWPIIIPDGALPFSDAKEYCPPTPTCTCHRVSFGTHTRSEAVPTRYRTSTRKRRFWQPLTLWMLVRNHPYRVRPLVA